MELDKLFGLPAHPLLVHIPVVMVPLAALIAVVLALRPSLLDRFLWILLAVTTVGAAGAVLAAGSGEALEESVEETAALEDHAELGEMARNVALVFFIVVAALYAFRWWSARRGEGGADVARSKAAVIATSVLLVLSGVSAGGAIAKAGHQGAKVTWSEEGNESQVGGDEDSDSHSDSDGEYEDDEDDGD